MKINKMETKNFGANDISFEGSELITALAGKNGSGKTTFLNAVKFAFTGKQNDSIKTGEKDMEVYLELSDGTSVLRKIKREGGISKSTVKLNGKTTTQKSLNEYFENAIGIKPENLEFLNSSQIIGDMDSEKLTEFFMGFIPIEMAFKKLTSLVSLNSDEEMELENLLPSKFKMGDIEDALSYYEDNRKITKKKLAEEEAKANYSGAEPKRKSEDINNCIAELLKKEGSYNALEEQKRAYKKAVENKERIEKMIKDSEEQVLRYSDVSAPNEAEINALEKKKNALSEELIEISRLIQTLNDNNKLLFNTLEKLDKTVCPISEKLICATDKTSVKDELTDMVKKNKDQIDKHITKENKIREMIENINQKIKAGAEMKQKYAEKIALMKKIQELRSTIPVLPAKPEDNSLDLTGIKSAIADLENERKEIIKYEAALKSAKMAENLKEKVALYERIVKLLKPKGRIYEAILNYALSPLEGVMNAKAAVIKPGFEVRFNCSNGISLDCKPKTTSPDFIDMKKCSAGEQILITLLVMDLVNQITGTRMISFDNLDRLDDESLKGLLEMLEKCESDYDHIFLSMVDHDDTIDVLSKAKKIDIKRL